MSVHVLYQRSSALDPVAVVAIQDAVDLAHFGPMDVAANHGVDATLARGQRDRVFETAYVLNGGLGLVLKVRR